MNCAIVTGSVRAFPCEEESSMDRGGQYYSRFVGSNFAVTVGPTRKRVGLPVVEVSLDQRFLDNPDIYTQQSRQSLTRPVRDKRMVLA